jgi:hypothetical protein
VEEGGFELWENGVGEETGVEDWREEKLGDGQTEPVRSKVREESSEVGDQWEGETKTFRGVCHRQKEFGMCGKM